jgi:hypothetical protein
MMNVARVWLASQRAGAAGAIREGNKHMRQKRMQSILMSLGLGALLTVGVGSWGMASAAPQAPVRPYTGQVREIKIDHCDLQPGTCEGSMVLAQVGGQQVALAIPSGTAIQRGDQRVHLEELGIGNYVTVQAMPLPNETTGGVDFFTGEVSRTGNIHVGTGIGERPPTLEESSQE